MTKKLIAPQGAGGLMGGAGGGSVPSAGETLQSVAYAAVLDLICEGEIQGIVNGMQGIYLNGVPVLEPDGVTSNFIGATIGWTNGTQTQTYMPGFPDVEATQTLGTQVINNVPITAAISNVAADSCIVTLSCALSSTDSNTGDISGTTVSMKVEYQPSGGSWITALSPVFDGYSTARYERSYQFPLTGTGPWTVRVSRLTPDSTNPNLVNPTYVDAVTTIVSSRLRYPNSALVGFQIDARQFASIPQRSYLIQGLKIRVPNNYNPVTRAYSGSWNGGFQVAYSNNPAWCLYDLLTSTRYGLGNYINTAEIDTVSLYEIGQYCDELVPDGFGGQEPRFALNMVINTAKDAYAAIQDICSVFRGMTYWGVGTILTTADMPLPAGTPMPLFSPANVINGAFNYAGSMRKDRHTVAYVTYNDPNQLYQQTTEYVEDPDGITRYGVRPTSVVAVGTTSRGQAHRLGLWTLLSERLNTDQLTFQAGLDAASLTPGQIIQIADPTRAARRMGGRTIKGTTTSIQLDAPVILDAGQTYTLYFMDATGTQQSIGVVNTVTTTASLTFTTAAPAAPNPGFMWTLSGTDLVPQLFRVINVQESARNVFDVLAITYNESKFNGVDFNTALVLPPVSLGLSLAATLPTSWSILPATYLIAPGVLGQKLVMSWSGTTAQYQLQYRANGGVWHTVQLTTQAYTLLGVTAGDIYDFRVYGVSSDGSLSPSLDETFTVPAKGSQPGAPTGLTATGGLRAIVLNWSSPPDLDLDYFQVFQSATNDIATAVLVGDKIGSTTWTVNGLGSGVTLYFWVRAVNTSAVIGPYNSNVGTSATTLYIQPGDFSLSDVLHAISTQQSVQTAQIGLNAVTNANIAAQAVASAQIQNAAVATAQLASGAVTGTNIAAATIGTSNITNAAITTALIGTQAVGTSQIQYAAITSALIANLAVGAAHIQNAAVGTLTIAGNAVTTQASWTTGAGTTLSGSFTSSGGQDLILFGGHGTVSLLVDGNTVAAVNGGGQFVLGSWVGTIGAGGHTLTVNTTVNSTINLSILETLR